MTQITIIVEDKTVVVDGVAALLPDLDVSKFTGDPTSPWDDIHAVQFNTKTGQGWVEYCVVATGQISRPDMKPPDWGIGKKDFDAMFGWVMPLYEAQITALKAEQEAAEKARMEAAKRAAEAPAQVAREGMDVGIDQAMLAEFTAMKAKVAAQDELLKNMLAEAAKVASEGT